MGNGDTIIMGNWAMVQTPIKAIRFKSRILLAILLPMLPLSQRDIVYHLFEVERFGLGNWIQQLWATGRWYNANKSNPVQVTDSLGNPLTNVAAIHIIILFLKSNGSVWATRNIEGQLGDGSTTQRSNPVQVKDSLGNSFTNVAAIAAGYNHTIFFKVGWLGLGNR